MRVFSFLVVPLQPLIPAIIASTPVIIAAAPAIIAAAAATPVIAASPSSKEERGRVSFH
jgi:hypothetical protein